MSDWALVIIAAVIVGYAALTRRLATTPITAAIVFVAAGLLFGHVGLDWLKLSFNDRSITVLATSTLVVVLFSDASRVDLHALRREYALPARLLGIGLPLTIVAGTVIGALLIPGITWPEAAVLAIVLAPTDAALGQAVVTNPDLPSRIRSALNVESGLNDGICVPLLTIMLAVAAADSGQESNLHAARLVAEAIGWGAFGGLVAGFAGAGLLRFARRRDLIAEAWIPIVPLMTAIASFAIADALGGSGFIAAFVAGVVYGGIAPRDPEATLLSEQLGNVLNAGTFIVFGAAILGVLWDKIGAIDIAVCRVQLDDRSHAAGRDRDDRNTSPTAHDCIRGLVRTARARVNRVRRRRRRRSRTASHLNTNPGDCRHGRVERARPRSHGATPRSPLRRMVHRSSRPRTRPDGKRPDTVATLARRLQQTSSRPIHP